MGKNLLGKELGEGLSQRESGLYQARFVSKCGKRISKSFKKLCEAKKWLAEASYEDNHSNIVAAAQMTVDSWFENWMNEVMKSRLRYNTIKSYEGRYHNRISPVIGKTLLSDVKPIHCQMVLNESKNKGDCPGSQAKIRSIMGAMFESAVENRFMESNPVTSGVKCTKGKSEQRVILTRGQQDAFMQEGERYAHFDEFVFILNTGLRCGEMKALRWEDINWQAREININGTMYYDHSVNRSVVNPPKTEAGKRTIPLTDDAYQILLDRKEAYKDRPVAEGYEDFVFVGKNGVPVRTISYNRCLDRIAKRIGVKNLTMHSLRHTFATRCIEDGMKPKVLQGILGHSNLSMTMDLYVHTTEDERTSEMKKLSIPRRKKPASEKFFEFRGTGVVLSGS